MSYTTKPIELPLSTDKEYVLVDKKGYRKSTANSKILDKIDLLNPFKLDRVDADGWGCIGGEFVIITNNSPAEIYNGEYKFFHEVIRQPQTNEFNTDSIAVTEQEEEAFNAMSEVEWKNGDECVFDLDCNGLFVGYYPKDKTSCVIAQPWFNRIHKVNVCDLSKPETPEQREERERDELAKKLFTEISPTGVFKHRDWEYHKNYTETAKLAFSVIDLGYRKQ